jgi:hypothetical protein
MRMEHASVNSHVHVSCVSAALLALSGGAAALVRSDSAPLLCVEGAGERGKEGDEEQPVVIKTRSLDLPRGLDRSAVRPLRILVAEDNVVSTCASCPLDRRCGDSGVSLRCAFACLHGRACTRLRWSGPLRRGGLRGGELPLLQCWQG